MDLTERERCDMLFMNIMNKVTFKSKSRRTGRSLVSLLLWQAGTVVIRDTLPPYPARRNNLTGAVQVKLRLNGWTTINEPEAFIIEKRK